MEIKKVKKKLKKKFWNARRFASVITGVCLIMSVAALLYGQENPEFFTRLEKFPLESFRSQGLTFDDIGGGSISIEQKYKGILKKVSFLQRALFYNITTIANSTTFITTLNVNVTAYNFLHDTYTTWGTLTAQQRLNRCYIIEPYVQDDYPAFSCTIPAHRQQLLNYLQTMIETGWQYYQTGISQGTISLDQTVVTITKQNPQHLDTLQIGDGTLITEYQSESFIRYSDTNLEINATLYKKGTQTIQYNATHNYTMPYWNSTTGDLFIISNSESYKFGANDTASDSTTLNTYKYEFKSNELIHHRNRYTYYVTHEGLWRHIDLTDICEEREVLNELEEVILTYNPNCLIEHTDNALTVEFISNNLIDPEIIIEITKAEHLNESYGFVSDQYENVKALDGTWSENITDGHYVRVTFEKNITSSRDITIYPRVMSGNPIVEVYEANKTTVLITFDNITTEQYYQELLTNLVGEQDTFDLKISGGTLQFDHIVDPAYTVILLSGTTWAVPADWNDADNSIEVIGAGGGGAGSENSGGGAGGGGGAGAYYANVTNVNLPEGGTVTIAIGSAGTAGSAGSNGGTGGDTYFCSTTTNCASIGGTSVLVGGKGSTGGSATGTAGTTQAGSVGDATIAGGTGGTGGSGSGDAGGGGGGGGGAGGSSAAGNTGSNGGAGSGESNGGSGGAGGQGDGTTGGAGGTGGNAGTPEGATSGGTGGDGTEFNSTDGSGGGGGGGGGAGKEKPGAGGGAAGSYGAGGGAGGEGGGGDGGYAGTVGTQGIIFIIYTTGGAPADEEYPEYSSSWDDNASLTDSGTGNFNITVVRTNGTVLLEIDGVNITATNLSATVYNASHTFSSSGDYAYRWHSWGNGTSEHYNVSNDYSYTVNASVDEEYPVFSNYYDNNHTVDGQTALFNVTLGKTNGTVFMEINGVNYTATNLTATVYNVSVTGLAVNDYTYYWGSWGNGSQENYNTSVTQDYTVLNNYGTLDVSITTPPDPHSLDQNDTFTINATVTCQGFASANCGTVYGLARYNVTGVPDTAITTTENGEPMFIQGGGSGEQAFNAFDDPIDFTSNLTAATYSLINMTSYVPAGATGVMFRTQTSGSNFAVRETGSTDDIYRYGFGNQYINGMVGLSDDLTFEVKLATLTGTDFYVIGYTMSGVTFFADATQRSPVGLSAWENLSISDLTGGDTAIGVIIEHWDTSGSGEFGIRQNGSTDNRIGRWLGHGYSITGLDSEEQFEAQKTSAAQEFWVRGYVTSGAVFNTNADDISLGTTGSFQDVDLTAYIGSDDIVYAFIENIDVTSSNNHGWRQNGSVLSPIGIVEDHTWNYVPVNNAEDLVQGYITDLTTDSFLVGYATAGGAAATNPQSTTLTQGQTWNVSWTVNGSGSGKYLIDVLFNSSLGNANVPDNSTADILINITTGAAADSCTYSGSGNHEYLCSDNCVISTENDYGTSNITASGTGTVTFNANQTGIDLFFKENACEVRKLNEVFLW